MKILAIDAATNVAGVALVDEKKLICEDLLDFELNHSKKLLPMINYVMQNCQTSFDELDYYAVTIGPGSFTGLRIGLATVKGLAQASDKKIIPISTLESLAYNLQYAQGLICPILDARRDQIYTALFNVENGQISRLEEDCIKTIDQLVSELKTQKKTIYLLGDGIERYEEALKQIPTGKIVEPYLRKCRPSSLAACAIKNIDKAQSLYHLEPLYIRPSYAEENKRQKS